MFNSNDDILNPVVAWARVVWQIRDTIPNFSNETKVCEFWDGKKVVDLNSSYVRSRLRAVVKLMG